MIVADVANNVAAKVAAIAAEVVASIATEVAAAAAVASDVAVNSADVVAGFVVVEVAANAPKFVIRGSIIEWAVPFVREHHDDCSIHRRLLLTLAAPGVTV